MKLAHIADLHCSREHAEEALASLRFFAEHIKTSPVDLVCIAGDVWDASILNTEASGYNRFVDAIREIADIAPVAMIYGTPSHDTDGSLEVFRKIDCRYGITILEPGQAYFYRAWCSEDRRIMTEMSYKEAGTTANDMLLFGIPEPRKKYLLAGEAADHGPMGKDETEEAVRDDLHRLCFHLADKGREYADLPCVVLYHGDVAGSTLQNDQTVERGTGIAVTVDDLADIGADYYALGHIHKPQKVGNLPAYYAGSIYPKNFGETHQAGFNVVELFQRPSFGDFSDDVERVDFPHPQNLKIDAKQNEALKMVKNMTDLLKNPDMVKGKKVWVDIAVTREDRAFLDADEFLNELYSMGAVEGSRVTISDIPVETVRAAE
jgi:exonuclease SbcD